ncbi:hypothetical protein [Anaerotignum sp.]
MITLTKESADMAMMVANMNVEQENAFFQQLDETGLFTKEEIKSFQIVVAYFKMQMFPERTRRIKEAMAEEMYAELNK